MVLPERTKVLFGRKIRTAPVVGIAAVPWVRHAAWSTKLAT